MEKRSSSLSFALSVLVLALIAGFVWQYKQTQKTAATVASLQASFDALADMASSTAATAASTTASVSELAKEQALVASSKGPQLEDAVKQVSPAVVSIVESKEVPKLQVTYENPFGNDPFFQGFGMQVPVYQHVGTTTQKVAAGTGFLVRSNGYIVTNKHVVPDTDATYTVLLSNGKQLNGTVIWRSSTEDLAVVKITGTGYPTISLGNSDDIQLGESVFAIGNALGEYSNSVSTGVVSGLNRSITAYNDQNQPETLNGVIQTDAAINPGNSGGPLVDLNGDVIGIDVAMVQGSENIGFALPINEVKSALSTLGI